MLKRVWETLNLFDVGKIRLESDKNFHTQVLYTCIVINLSSPMKAEQQKLERY